MTVPRAASFAVSLVVGTNQESLPGMSVGELVIDDVVECLALFVGDKEQELEDRIQDPAYLTNFKALAKAISPDGKEIEMVGFTSVREGREKSVAMRPIRPPAIPAPSFGTVEDSERTKDKGEVSVTGALRFADALEHKEHLIKLLDDSGNKHSVVVPPGMMDDIVRPLWSSRVTVTGRPRRGRILLTDIRKERGY